MRADLGFVHVYQPPSPSASARQGLQPSLSAGQGLSPSSSESQVASRTLLMLHGTGGNEHDLLPLARTIAPEAGVLSPRGQVLERGMPRFFRRLAEGVFDLDDLQRRTHELAEFVARAAELYAFDPRRLVAVGFSNGANIAGSLLLLRPEALGAAVLIRAMVPLEPQRLPSLTDTPVLISNGRRDPLVAPEETERLAALLKKAGADVTVAWQPGGHELTSQDAADAESWLSERSAIL